MQLKKNLMLQAQKSVFSKRFFFAFSTEQFEVESDKNVKRMS